MALESIPLWAVRPDWRSPVIETLEWLTAIHRSPTGAEQRQQLRLTPRRSLEFSITATGAEQSHLLRFLETYGGGRFYLPLWHETGRLTRSEATGSLAATVGGERSELAAADAVCAPTSQAHSWPLAEVSSGSASGGVTNLTLAAPGWPDAVSSGQRVLPAVPAQLDGSAVTFSRRGDSALTAFVRVELLGPQPWAGADGLTTYDSYPVVDLAPNEGRDQTGSLDWSLLNLDNQTGARDRLDLGGRGFLRLAGVTTVAGRDRHDTVRSVLYALAGRRSQGWFPTPFADFRLASPVADGATQIEVIRSGYWETGAPLADNDRLLIRLRGGELLIRQIVDSTVDVEADTEILTVDSAIPLGFSAAQVKRLSLLMPARLDQDRVELQHITDTDGVCEINIAVRRVPVLRSAEAWTPQEFPRDEPE